MAWAFVAKTEPSLRARAMRFLARREHSRAELQRKLAAIARKATTSRPFSTSSRAKAGFPMRATRSSRCAPRRGASGRSRSRTSCARRAWATKTIAPAFRSAGADGAANLGASVAQPLQRGAGERARARPAGALPARAAASRSTTSSSSCSAGAIVRCLSWRERRTPVRPAAVEWRQILLLNCLPGDDGPARAAELRVAPLRDQGWRPLVSLRFRPSFAARRRT